MLTDEQMNDVQEQVHGFRFAPWEFTEPGGCFTLHRAVEAAACAERDARIAHLEATASANYKRGHDGAHSMLSERIAELERQLEEVRKDAERYRWLQAHQLLAKVHILPTVSGESLDAAIDAAMKGTL